MIKIGIIGKGVIGSAIAQLFNNTKDIEVFFYDVMPPFNTQTHKNQIDACDFAFVCVPTPFMGRGLEMNIVTNIVQEFNPSIFIICSALQPGTADSLSNTYKKNIVVQPEYFGETASHPLTELKKSNFLILGGKSEVVDNVINLYQKIYNANTRIRKVSAYEAEIIKLSENRAIAFKVLQCQELYDACKKNGVDYNVIREAVYGDDPRFNLWWTFVYDDNRGLSSKCLPKDLYGWRFWAKSSGSNTDLTDAALAYNGGLLQRQKERRNAENK